MSEPRPSEWHWLWDLYVAGLCLAAMVAVSSLNHRFPGNVPLALAALAGITLCVIAFARRVIHAGELWPTVAFLATVIGLWTVALWASPVAFTAIPAFYPLIFAPLPLSTALVVTTAVNFTPLAVVLITGGARSPNIGLTVAFTLMGLIAGPVIGLMLMRNIRQRQRLTTLVTDLQASRAESARLSREAGTAAERERLAREIHDTLAQGFTSIVTLAQAVEAELASDPDAARKHVALIRATARENLAEARAMVAELSPTALNGSLPAAIQRQCDRLAAEAGIAAALHAQPGLPPLGMAADVVLLRATQEAFANVRKHARATTVTVELSRSDCGVRLSVADNGIGLGDENAYGFGLPGMRTRVAQVGGTMTIGPTPGGGTTVTVEVPS